MTATDTNRRDRRFRLAANDNETLVEDGLTGRRFRLATNDNETVAEDLVRSEGEGEADVQGHSLTRNDNEIVVDAADTPDVEGHALTRNDNEIVVDGAGPTRLSNHRG